MLRRNFIKRCVAAVIGGLCGGAATVVAQSNRQKSEVLLMRAGGMTFIDWFDQKPGDLIAAYWPSSKRMESWVVTGRPCWNNQGVEAVQIKDELYYPDCWAWTFDAYTHTLRGCRLLNGETLLVEGVSPYEA